MAGTGARGSGSFGDALRTTAVMGALLLGMFVVGLVVTVKPQHAVPEVNLADAVERARSVARFDVFAPTRLPAGARATSARSGPTMWHLGVVTADDFYVGLEQAPLRPKTMIRDFAPTSRSVGTARLGGLLWAERTEPDGDRVYVLDLGESTVLIVGSAPKPDLERYVASLSSP